VLTYTKAAAGEFRERLGAALGKKAASEVTCGTFHSFCLSVCREHAAALGRTAEFILYGEAQSRKVAAAAAAALGLVGAAGGGGGGAAAAGDERAVKAAASRCAARLARHKAAGDTPASLAAAGNAEDASILQARLVA
jgi:superfamily I DNA/RNA helicase